LSVCCASEMGHLLMRNQPYGLIALILIVATGAASLLSVVPWLGSIAKAEPLSAGVEVAVPNQEEVLIILDASGSMADRLDSNSSENKLTIAKQTLKQVLSQLPANAKVGLRIYGNSRGYDLEPCRASSLVVPIAQGNGPAIIASLKGLRASGATPISFSMQQALRYDFSRYASQKTIILISDGEETCDADPCSVAVDMARQNIQFKVNVIGFGDLNTDALQQLKCVAATTFGRFSHATTKAELAQQLGQAVQAKKTVNAQLVIPGQSNGPSSSSSEAVGTPSGSQAPTTSPTRPGSGTITNRSRDAKGRYRSNARPVVRSVPSAVPQPPAKPPSEPTIDLRKF
jgi:von Willebrand factor type A domain